jgi:hypothetical protein
VALLGFAYLLIVRPSEHIREDARPDAAEML